MSDYCRRHQIDLNLATDGFSADNASGAAFWYAVQEGEIMKYASVTDVVRRIKDDIHGDYRLQSIAMEGNIIGLKRASNGHYYMNIRDDQCSIQPSSSTPTA